jgi:hypothetical protein
LEHSHPGAAGSLPEELADTLTVARLGITGSLKRTLASTNPYESMIECVRRTSRNVKHWQSGEMALRWTAAGMLEAERQCLDHTEDECRSRGHTICVVCAEIMVNRAA